MSGAWSFRERSLTFSATISKARVKRSFRNRVSAYRSNSCCVIVSTQSSPN